MNSRKKFESKKKPEDREDKNDAITSFYPLDPLPLYILLVVQNEAIFILNRSQSGLTMILVN
jgi:hypothetical protein